MKKQIRFLLICLMSTFVFSSCLEDGIDLFENITEGSTVETTTGLIQLYQLVDGSLVPIEKGSAEEAWMENPIKHKELWDFYKTMIPSSEISWIKQFEVYHGGGEEYGYVTNLDEGLEKWRLGLAIEGAFSNGLNGDKELAHTIIHEQFHVMSLNRSQLDPYTSSCDYDTEEGCSLEDSYLDDFVEMFWSDILEEHRKINPNNQNKLFRFYEKYESQFVNDYAATNPEEDIAESFTYFVKNDKRANPTDLRDKKINHFYQYDELVKLRDDIRSAGVSLGIAKVGEVMLKKKGACCKRLKM